MKFEKEVIKGILNDNEPKKVSSQHVSGFFEMSEDQSQY